MTDYKHVLTVEDVKAMRGISPNISRSAVLFKLQFDGATMRLSEKTERLGMSVDAERIIHVNNGTRESAYFHLYPYIGTWQALCALVKAGDALIVSARQNNNQYMDDAGLYHDELLVSIVRKGKAIVRDMVLMSSNCPANSARAISA